MDIQHLRELMALMIEKDVAELQVEQHGVSVRIRRPEPVLAAAQPMIAPGAVAMPALTAADIADPLASHADAHIVRSPMVGTFYASAEPGADAFVSLGDRVESGQTLCIVEAMKLMNEITAEVTGEIVAVFPEDAKPVEYGQELFAIRVA